MVIISLITLIEAIFSDDIAKTDQSSISVSFTLFQMSALFEAGITLVGVVILHNWFPEKLLGTVIALWTSAVYLQTIAQEAIYNKIEGDEDKILQTVKLQSYSLFGCYLLLAIVCWFVFWHHPSHIGIKLRSNHENSQSFGFVVDNTTTFWNPNATGISNNNQRNINSTIAGTKTTT